MKRFGEFALLFIIAVMYATVCMETDIYVPAFPDMKLFFAIDAQSIQQVLSFNFIGICLGSLIVGPLSDTFGRRKVLLLGLSLFAISSYLCCTTVQFQWFLISRFFQGIGAATPMVITFAILLEQYEPKKVAQLCGALNLFITGVMAMAPILGSYLNIHYGWRFNFIVIAVLALFSLLASFIVVPETLPVQKRNSLSLSLVMKNYGKVITSFPYLAAALVCYLMFAGLVLFIANLSIIFIEYLGVSKETYAFYQASPLIAFALFSLFSIWIIEYFGTYKTKHAGSIITCVGTALLIVAAIVHANPILICAAMVCYTIGITLAAPIYGTESASVFPDMLGIATGMSNALRYVVVAGLVSMGSFMFDGSIKPVVTLIGISICVVMILVAGLAKQHVIQSEAS